MSISPAGKTRIMKAQTFANPLANPLANNDQEPYAPDISQLSKSLTDDTPELNEETSVEDIPSATDISTDEDIPSIEEPKNEKKTLSDFIFKTLEGFGYPGRRLEEFKKKFVEESISPDGIKDIKVEIPDKYYPNEMGQTKTIETDDLSKIVSEIEKTFGLNFNGAKRSDGKWTINLTSAQKSEKNPEEMTRDNLDEVYGTPKAKKDQNIQAYTQKELISMQKDSIVTNLKNIIGDKNV